MKKLLSFIIVLMMILSTVSCLDEPNVGFPVTEETDNSATENTTVSDITTENPSSHVTDPQDTSREPSETEPAETESTDPVTQPPETEAPKQETQPPETEPPKQETQPPETEPPKQETQPPETEPPKQETQPPETEAPKMESTFSIHFIDVGQADAALVECDNRYMLIDGGNKGDSNIIYSVLKKAGVKKLDIVVATHGHEDHVGGIPGAFNYTTADITLSPITSFDSKAFSDFKKYADQNGGGITVPRVGDTYKLGSAKIEILGVNSSSDANDCSIVLMITYGDTKFLFTGDAERAAEEAILRSGADLSATLLKVGHHGSADSTTYPFLREIMPKYAVISVGEGNSYGHPTENTLSRLRDADVKVFRTDIQGDVYCSSNGKTVSVSVSRNAGADTFSPPKGSTVTTPPVTTPPETDPPVTTPPVTTPPETDPPETKPPANVLEYVLNTNTKKFHYPSCSSVKQMSEKNKGYYTGTRDEVLSLGYDPCGRCNP
ncbi:MAG: MBL fold metallo-hydrolase [Clostridia bacterium]|nr:MBL fold metallo-hydrolase [Clostridia bacterium]